MSSILDKNSVQNLEKKLNITFDKKQLLETALIHKSFKNENKEITAKDNERLEFLGDSVLNLAVTDFLFKNYSGYTEGELAKIKAVVVSEDILKLKAEKLNLGKFILMGRGEELTGGRSRKSILADTLEAILGAIYLDKNFKFIKEFIQSLFKSNIINIIKSEQVGDYKTIFQELVQKDNKRPVYEVIDKKGPEHDLSFKVEVKVDNKTLGLGEGPSKKEAEQEAAREALKKLNKN